MLTTDQEHIVNFVDFTDEVEPLLIMEYLPLGNLRDQHRITAIAPEESLYLLLQGLEALEYLHLSGHAHRDIKPENILVRSRAPFSIKIADFGMAKDVSSSALKTCCGTYLYTAPEIWKRSRYTPLVDIWSLGLVIYTFTYGLPDLHGNFSPERWYRKLNKSISDWDSDVMIDFLSATMLKMDPKERPSAQECLKKASGLLSAMIPEQDSGEVSTPIEVATFAMNRAFRSRNSILQESRNLRATPTDFDQGSSRVSPTVRKALQAANNNVGQRLVNAQSPLLSLEVRVTMQNLCPKQSN